MRNTNRNWKAGIFLMLVLFQSVIACNNGGGGSGAAGAPVNPYGYGGYNPMCPTCTAGMGGMPLLTNVKSATGSERVLFGLDVLATGGTQVNMYDPKAAVMYSGMAAIAGTMRVLDPNDSMFCYTAPGDYTVQTVEPIMMGSLMLAGGRLIAQGPGGQLNMRIMNAQFYNSTETVWSQSQNNRVGFNLSVERNGMPCGTVSTF